MEWFVLTSYILVFALIASSVYTITQAEFEDRRKKALWIIVVIVAPILGSLLWTLMRRNFLAKKRIQFR